MDLAGNPVCETEEYKRDAIYAMIPSLEILDMKTKDDEDYFSPDDSDDDGLGDFEGGEDEIEENVALLEAKLTDEQK